MKCVRGGEAWSPHALGGEEDELPVALAVRYLQHHVHGDPAVHHVLQVSTGSHTMNTRDYRDHYFTPQEHFLSSPAQSVRTRHNSQDITLTLTHTSTSSSV